MDKQVISLPREATNKIGKKKRNGAKGWRRRSQSHRLAPAGAKSLAAKNWIPQKSVKSQKEERAIKQPSPMGY